MFRVQGWGIGPQDLHWGGGGRGEGEGGGVGGGLGGGGWGSGLELGWPPNVGPDPRKRPRGLSNRINTETWNQETKRRSRNTKP